MYKMFNVALMIILIVNREGDSTLPSKHQNQLNTVAYIEIVVVHSCCYT